MGLGQLGYVLPSLDIYGLLAEIATELLNGDYALYDAPDEVYDIRPSEDPNAVKYAMSHNDITELWLYAKEA